MPQAGGPWYRELRRNDRALSREETLAFIDSMRYGVLAMAWPDGRPYAVPINYGRAGDTIYMHCARTGLKLDILRANPRAALTVMEAGEIQQGDAPCATSISYRSAIAFGHVSELAEEGPMLEGLRVLCRACGIPTPDDGTPGAAAFAARARDTIVLALTVEHFSGKAKA